MGHDEENDQEEEVKKKKGRFLGDPLIEVDF